VLVLQSEMWNDKQSSGIIGWVVFTYLVTLLAPFRVRARPGGAGQTRVNRGLPRERLVRPTRTRIARGASAGAGAINPESVSLVYRDVLDDVWTTVTIIGLNSQGRGKTSLRTTSMGNRDRRDELRGKCPSLPELSGWALPALLL
jgi:hypothetical protein